MFKQKVDSTRQQIHLLCMLWAQEAIIAKTIDGLTLTLKKVDPKVLYMTAQPSKNRAFIRAKKFITLWIENSNAFENEPPEIAISYTNMQLNSYGAAEAIPIALSAPTLERKNSNNWVFQLNFLDEKINLGNYRGVSLFIDWLPSFECPQPIKCVLPNLISKI